ncbi:hypothetical protein IQ269_03195 [Tychonema sp. LEGE 07199]|uniref:hypothetical protein n=1 Tax=Microcoleaceae TaxID=1892252 RepID=UPI0018812A1E|nr:MULTISPECIES: hypothetical protein [unclassified Tychonema]MBE9119835.1 hypothetical protein [Tychonema sp. LEGE 07199]MBE9132424.1 hypothetical protein [Tychonema sp. LEGE 07196]
MSDIFVMVRNQNNVAMTSVDGIAFITLLNRDGRVLAEETVALMEADAGFDDLAPGQYTVIVRHEQVEPQSAKWDVTIGKKDRVIILTFVYLEPERVLLRILATVEDRL